MAGHVFAASRQLHLPSAAGSAASLRQSTLEAVALGVVRFGDAKQAAQVDEVSLRACTLGQVIGRAARPPLADEVAALHRRDLNTWGNAAYVLALLIPQGEPCGELVSRISVCRVAKAFDVLPVVSLNRVEQAPRVHNDKANLPVVASLKTENRLTI